MNLILSHLTTVCVQWFCDSVGKVLVGSVRSAQSGLAPHHFDPFFEKRITLILKCLFAPSSFFFIERIRGACFLFFKGSVFLSWMLGWLVMFSSCLLLKYSVCVCDSCGSCFRALVFFNRRHLQIMRYNSMKFQRDATYKQHTHCHCYLFTEQKLSAYIQRNTTAIWCVLNSDPPCCGRQ